MIIEYGMEWGFVWPLIVIIGVLGVIIVLLLTKESEIEKERRRKLDEQRKEREDR